MNSTTAYPLVADVSGRVTRLIAKKDTGEFLASVVSVAVPGQDGISVMRQDVQVWGLHLPLDEDVHVRGALSVGTREYQGRSYARVSLNAAERIED